MIAQIIQLDREHLFDDVSDQNVKLPAIKDALPPIQERLLRDFFAHLQPAVQNPN